MKLYFAPMEGLVGYVYRNAYEAAFGNIDKYFSPFIATNQHGVMKTRDREDVLPEHNRGVHLVPQILTRQADAFLVTARQLQEMGYEEINLNLGCPSRTVVAKGKGSGFLEDPEELDRFFDQVFADYKGELSVKTRIGIDSPDEWEDLLRVYRKYPFSEVIIHPRTQQEYYEKTPHMEAFEKAAQVLKVPLCYNGNIFTVEDYENLKEKYSGLGMVMMGRGIVRNPGLPSQIKGKDNMSMKQLEQFHEQILEDYERILSGEKNVLFKMKEVWLYLIDCLEEADTYRKKIKKVQKVKDFRHITKEIFNNASLKK
ncbi:MAG: tRNA-dihydrouridine synthase family protein [Lachnospiraceae bacterium]|jgi:tRNA-dihydrouridine synthase|nr:tRNA-dihydrouridine synthase family protein [Lachnospiraceae bacterium]MDD3615543.1 tRNA-dihydrouridine synthase family protein [Lachnospiraceae bacterium]